VVNNLILQQLQVYNPRVPVLSLNFRERSIESWVGSEFMSLRSIGGNVPYFRLRAFTVLRNSNPLTRNTRKTPAVSYANLVKIFKIFKVWR
jgi:hypothetical protein